MEILSFGFAQGMVQNDELNIDVRGNPGRLIYSDWEGSGGVEGVPACFTKSSFISSMAEVGV